jgi:UDP-glucose 4-epimerase
VQVLNSPPGASEHRVLMFGLGMLGSAIRARLQEAHYTISADIPFPWQQEAGWKAAFASIGQRLANRSPPERLSVVWSAGKAGFSCTRDELRSEYAAFQAVLEFFAELKARFDPCGFDAHCISSAGGLFEGQRVVGSQARPAPVRPYGELKLAQEDLLQRTFARSEIAIYRPSSVYGPMAQKGRQGLINNLVSDGLAGRATVLDAHISSLRDYVYAGDIGRFVAGRIRAGGPAGAIHFLVSGRCTSIHEVVHTVERVLHLRLRFRYDESFGNHSNITFSDSVLPSGWAASPLDVGIRQFVAGKHANPSLQART